MILQALTQYYEALLKLGHIGLPGWSKVSVSYALDIDDSGSLAALYDLQTPDKSGKRMVGLKKPVPASETRTSGVAANFLCDNTSYFLGVDSKGKPARTAKCFAASKELHLKLLQGVDSPAAKAVCAYFNNWQPDKAAEHPVLKGRLDDLMKVSNIVFWHNGRPVLEDEAVKRAWQQSYDSGAGGEDGAEAVCLVTGERGSTVRKHPGFTGIPGAQSSGAMLVSFNEQAFCSYGHEQGENSPTGKYAAFAYGEALKYLLADKDHVCRVGDTTIVCWAQSGQAEYQGFTLGALLGSAYYKEGDILSGLSALAKGHSIDWDGSRLDPNMQFYILGLAPNAARLSVRFFWQNSFGSMAANLKKHYERLEIISPSFDNRPLSIWRLALETTRRKKDERKPGEQGEAKAESSSASDMNPRLAGDLLLAVLADSRYPATLLNGVALRIRAEGDVTRGKAAIIKAYHLKNSNNTQLKEVLTVELNDQSSYAPYVLGRLFSVLEAVQDRASQESGIKLNTTIKDRYFNSASSTPAAVFPTLIRLSQAHLGKLKEKDKIYYSNLMTELFSRITESLPKHLDLEQQGAFQIGYYHQTQKRYAKKEETENV